MITAQLGPPPAVPGRASTAEGSAGDDAPGTSTATGDDAFVALLLGIGPSANGADEAAPPSPAAGPLTGELLTETDAEAAGLTPPAPPAAGTPPVANAAASAPRGAATTALTAAAPAASTPVGGSTEARIVTSGRPDQAAATPASPAAPSTGSASLGAPRRGDASAVPVATGAPTAPPVQAPAIPAAAATVTITLSRQEAPVTARAEGAPASAAPSAAPPVATVPPPAAATPPAAPESGSEAPAPAVSPPVHVAAPGPAPAAGHVGMPSGVTSAAELAHELGARMRMAVREGGRELVVNLRPPELGHLTVRVTMIDGSLTAHITADRPDAVRLLQQSLPQLGAVLGDLGYNLDGLDVTYGGQDRRDAPGSSPDGHTADAGAHGASDDGSAAIPVSSTAATVTDGDRLDLLV